MRHAPSPGVSLSVFAAAQTVTDDLQLTLWERTVWGICELVAALENIGNSTQGCGIGCRIYKNSDKTWIKALFGPTSYFLNVYGTNKIQENVLNH